MTESTERKDEINTEPPGGRERFFGLTGRIVVTVLVVLLSAEVITRVIDFAVSDVPLIGLDEDNTLYREHPYLYKVPIANARFEKYEVNAHGFRGRAFKVPKPAGVFRILTLGGSSTWDSNVSGTDKTWSAQLEDLLNAERRAGAPKFEVVNGGIPGHNSAESVMNFVWRGLPIQPDAVITYQGYNDYKANRFPGFKSDYSHLRTRDHSLSRALSQTSRLFYHLRRFLTRRKPKTTKKEDKVTQPGIDAYTDNLRKIAVMARDRGIQPMFTTFAMPLTEENAKTHRNRFRGLHKYLVSLTIAGASDAHKKYNSAVQKLGSKMGVPVVDTDGALPKDFDHFTDHTHFTDRGSSVMAATLAKAVRGHLKIPTRKNP